MAIATEGFSFAYLKELFLSSMVHWISAMETRSIEEIMTDQIAILQAQMNSVTTSTDDSDKIKQ